MAPSQRATKPSKARKTLAAQQPSAAELAAARWLLEPWQLLTAPRFYGLERLPRRRPALFVANHTLMGVLDVPLLVLGLHERCGVFVRSLGDHLHFQIPIWRDLLSRFGTVEGTPENCSALMHAGESVLVFPGGGREVFKRKGEQYHLIWKQRMGFARLAIQHGYPIVPVAAVGAEECYDIVADHDDLMHTPIGPLIERWVPRADEIPPLVRGVGPLPRPQRFYFHFGKPIETTSYVGKQSDDAVCFTVREKTRRAVQRGIRFLLKERETDPGRNLPARLLAQLTQEEATPARAKRRLT